MTFDTRAYTQLLQLQKTLLRKNIPFVSFRMPDGQHITTYVQYRSRPEKIEQLQQIANRKGFVVAPFSGSESTFFLQPDDIFIDADITEQQLTDFANKTVAKVEIKKVTDQKTTSHEEFTNNVQQAVHAMKSGQFHKVVLSKIRTEMQQSDFSTPDFFFKLCKSYPHAMVYLLQIPEVGIWAGATPEPLLLATDNIFRTVSLAGTQVAKGLKTEEYSWTAKETEEQGIVTGFIESTLKNSGARNIKMNGPVNEQAANLIHLKTSFEFEMGNNVTDIGNLVAALHPTPSIGGLPRQQALDFIRQHEQHQRTYYSGFLGHVEAARNTALYVNLRCVQLFEKEFVLYSGAGITAASVPENEWNETDNKMLTMLNVIRSSFQSESI